MAQVQRPNCTGIVRTGPRTGLPCSVYAGDGIFGDYCFHHVPEELTLEDEEQCAICLEEKKISWISSCPCKLFYCKECLVQYQNTVRGVTDCPTCRMPMNDTSMLSKYRSRRQRQLERPSNVRLDFTFLWYDTVACSVTELPPEAQEDYWRTNYIQPLYQFLETKYRDLNVIAPALDWLRKKRVKKLMKSVGEDPVTIVKEYEKYILEENYEDYSVVNNMPGENYRSIYGDNVSTKMFPYNISHIYWVCSHDNSYICFYRDTASQKNCFMARQVGKKWVLALYLEQLVVDCLSDLEVAMPYFYKQYRVDAREFWQGELYYDDEL